ncbi:MAG: copper amine oxidase N-terminal domain-containing protein [Clostridia bacterium]|nr:copper amine oxidase N-terminal domain-containing protein [Clostridia bacterium]
MMKKIMSIVLCVAILCTMFTTVFAAGELRNAKTYTLGKKVWEQIKVDETDAYAFELTESGKLTVKFTGYMEYATLKLYDESGEELWSETPHWNSTVAQISFEKVSHLTKGGYYFTVSEYWDKEGDYEFTIDSVGAGESFPEPQGGSNNTVRESDKIYTGVEYIGQIAINDTVDTYNFSMAQSGRIGMNYTGYMEYSELKIYDENGKEIWSTRPHWNGTVEQISFSENIYLTSGKYYFSVSEYWSSYGNYSFKLDYESSNESFIEPNGGGNNPLTEADVIVINQAYNGQLAINDEVDSYKINLPGGKVKFTITAPIEYVYVKLYDSTGKEVWSKNPRWNSTNKLISFESDIELSAGNYYVTVSKDGSRCGNYTFAISTGYNVKAADPEIPTVKVVLNGKQLQFDQNPIIDTGRTLVPVRAIFEAMGATVEWYGDTQTVISKKGNTTISMVIGNNAMYKNDSYVWLDVPPQIFNGRTLVPVRAIAEAYGCNVTWDGANWTVVITN